MGSNPSAIYWMYFFALICCKNCIVCLQKKKIKKEAGVGPFFTTAKETGYENMLTKPN